MNILDLIITPAFAQDTISESGLGGLVPIALLFVVFYFLLIRPQQKRAKEHKALLSALKIADEVVTNGGILGKVVKVDESFVNIEISKGVIVRAQKQGINQKLPKGSVNL